MTFLNQNRRFGFVATTCSVPAKCLLHAADLKLLGLMLTTCAAIGAMNLVRTNSLATLLQQLLH